MVSGAPLASRVVEVIADLGDSATKRYRYGSGCIVRGRTVLTAAHVVAGATALLVRDPNKRLYPAAVDPRFVGNADGPGPDLALVEVSTSDLDLPPMGLAAVDRDNPEVVERCHAVGYPWFAQTPSPTTVRDTVDAVGVVPVLSKLARGLLSLQVHYPPRPLPPEGVPLTESPWSGMSGAPVVADGWLLGVVTEHGPREGPSGITAVPLTALEPNPSHPGWGPGVADPAGWWSRLGVSGLGELRRLPARPQRPAPAYLATLREFGRTLHRRMPKLLGRQQELAELAAFASGPGGYRWLVGGAWAGKTALVYEAITAGLPAEVDVACYFLSRRASDANSNRFLAAVVPQLAYLCGVDPPAADRDQFYALWEKATNRAADTGRHLLLVVDGLDEDLHPSGSPTVASLLPSLVDGYAHVLVTSRPGITLSGLPAGHPLAAARQNELKPFEGSAELAGLAREEIDDLVQGPDADLAVEVLGPLAAAAGALSVKDLATLSNDDLAPPTAVRTRQVRRVVTEAAARSLEPVGPTDHLRYQFAHPSLLEYGQMSEEFGNAEYRDRIHRWAEQWRARGWPVTPDAATSTPRYLLDSYPGSLAGGRRRNPGPSADDRGRLAALVGDISWVAAAISTVGVDQALATLRTARDSAPAGAVGSAVLAVVAAQAQNLRPPRPVDQPSYVLRQLCLQAMELGYAHIADAARTRQRALGDPGPVPLWTTRRASPALTLALGSHRAPVRAVAEFDHDRVVTGGDDRRVLLWDPTRPGVAPVELGSHRGPVLAVGRLGHRRVLTGGEDRRVLVWDATRPGHDPVELGSHLGPVRAVATGDDGRAVTCGDDWRVLLWDPTQPGRDPVELGSHDGPALAVAWLGDGRVVSGGFDRRVLVWDPAHPGHDPIQLGAHADLVGAIAELGDGRVVSGGDDRRLLLWDPARPGRDAVELGRHDGPVLAVATRGDGRVVSGGFDRRVLVWDPAHLGQEPVELGAHDGHVEAVAWLGDGRVVSGGEDRQVLLWDAAAPDQALVGEATRQGSVLAVAWLGDGRVVSGGEDRRVLLWNPTSDAAAPVELGRQRGVVWTVAGLDDGRVVSGGADGRVLLWDPANPGAGPLELGSHDGPALAVAGLADGRVISGGYDRRVLLWDPTQPGRDPVELGRHRGVVWTVDEVDDGRVVTGGADRRVLVWDPTSPGRDPVELGSHRGPARAVAGLDGGRVVSGGDDGRVLLWDPSRPGDPIQLEGYSRRVRGVAGLSDGRVVSGGDDRLIVVSEPSTGERLAEIACTVRALAIDPPHRSSRTLLVAHEGAGLSAWSVADAAPR